MVLGLVESVQSDQYFGESSLLLGDLAAAGGLRHHGDGLGDEATVLFCLGLATCLPVGCPVCSCARVIQEGLRIAYERTSAHIGNPKL